MDPESSFYSEISSPYTSLSLQNMVPLLDGPTEGGAPASSQQQLQEQEKLIEISCTLATEASRRSRILSGEGSVRTTAPSWEGTFITL